MLSTSIIMHIRFCNFPLNIDSIVINIITVLYIYPYEILPKHFRTYLFLKALIKAVFLHYANVV